MEPEAARRQREHVIAVSRGRYATRREEVEAYLGKAVPPNAQEPVPEKPPHRGRPEGSAAPPSKVVQPDAVGSRPTPPPAAPTLPGRGGPQHKYLQDLIKRWAEGRGWHVTIEKPVLDGLGNVDVALEKDGGSVACEISITSTADYEAGNVQKCLAAGFQHVVLVSSDKKVLAKARSVICEALNPEQIKRVRFLTPEEFFSFVEALEVTATGKGSATESRSEILTAREVESMLRIDVKTIYSYVQKGLLPYVRIQSNLRFLRSEIEKWVAEHRFRPKGPKKD